MHDERQLEEDYINKTGGMNQTDSSKSSFALCTRDWTFLLRCYVHTPTGPLAEMDHWQARHEVLGGLYEPLDMPHARKIVLLLKSKSTDRNLLASFHTQYTELVKVQAPLIHLML